VKFQTPANDRGPLRFWETGSRNPSPHAELPPPADPQAIDRLSLGLFLIGSVERFLSLVPLP
jgi:hypothetical protein